MKLLYILLGSLTVSSVNAQVTDVNEWQLEHPEVIFIEHDVYSLLEESQLDKLHNVIVYNSSIKIEDIESYLTTKSTNLNSTLFDYADPDADLIKQWLGKNKDVLIVRIEKMNTLTPEEQANMISLGTLILTEEYLTLDKIFEYEANR